MRREREVYTVGEYPTCRHGQLGGSEFCIQCLRTRSDALLLKLAIRKAEDKKWRPRPLFTRREIRDRDDRYQKAVKGLFGPEMRALEKEIEDSIMRVLQSRGLP